ncbi:methyl-accepting chemotaxis protein [Halorientalis regularis]|jgi:methyl-accepting chemotaxis protein|uniref:Methyl-accepting chemotaxis sensory transducer with Pas/Pac sensor n=1 Tax=Halorientalis regularis TaxID=660518 RepID=A0A1G7RIX6_9EURY|nr:methyl-accepting chemotaxis protein [Halorientalis regularis]SDG10728.1 methyl-accepting chemotaxis sensory transducer with Pas/Pac sensor [Halorientalis regularis]
MTRKPLSALLSLAAEPGDGSAGDRSDAIDGVTAVGVDPTAVAGATDDALDDERADEVAAALSAEAWADGDDERDRRAEALADLLDGGVDPATLVGAHEPLVDRLVERAFADVDGGDEAAAALKRDLGVALGGLAGGLDAAAATDGPVPGIGLHDLLDAVPYSTFLIDADHTVIGYNQATADQLDLDETAELGEDCRESIAAATYSDGRRHDTLADKVVESPRTAHEEYDVDRIDDSYAFGDRIVYEDRSLMKKADGTEQHISFQAMPIFEEGGELQGVLELVEDQSEAINRQEALSGLVEEVCTTLEALSDGDFTARAEFEDDGDHLDDDLLRIVREVNEMIDDFEELIGRVGDGTADLADSIRTAAEAADEIDRQVSDQTDALSRVAEEMEDFSATMEEVASSANQVSTAADEALEEADEGEAAGRAARERTDDVLETSRELVETVNELEEYMDEIEAVTDVIADIAEQTNILALNANIEAARAGEAGEGFAVVADEVKELADETQHHTQDISEQIEAVQAQTAETVEEVQRSHERIQVADERIQEAVASLQEISEGVEAAADGIGEVADANDEQAATVEEVLATVDEARESAETVERTVEDIVAETERQQRAVSDLSDHVSSLSAEE